MLSLIFQSKYELHWIILILMIRSWLVHHLNCLEIILVYNQFQSRKTFKMMFPSWSYTAPQYYFYYLYPSPAQSIPTVTPPETISSKLPQAINQSSSSDQVEKIYVTRQDLVKEGYQQTKKPWNQQEDRLLLRLCKNENSRFEEIATQIEGRNAKMCYSRFRRLSYQTKVSWNRTLDQQLLSLVKQYGEDDWKRISTHFQGRTPKQLKDHYQNYLKTDLNRNDWTLEEDLYLVRLLNTYGRNWKQIENRLPGRCRNQIKNRFFGKITRLNNRKISQMANLKSNF